MYIVQFVHVHLYMYMSTSIKLTIVDSDFTAASLIARQALTDTPVLQC